MWPIRSRSILKKNLRCAKCDPEPKLFVEILIHVKNTTFTKEICVSSENYLQSFLLTVISRNGGSEKSGWNGDGFNWLSIRYLRKNNWEIKGKRPRHARNDQSPQRHRACRFWQCLPVQRNSCRFLLKNCLIERYPNKSRPFYLNFYFALYLICQKLRQT